MNSSTLKNDGCAAPAADGRFANDIGLPLCLLERQREPRLRALPRRFLQKTYQLIELGALLFRVSALDRSLDAVLRVVFE